MAMSQADEDRFILELLGGDSSAAVQLPSRHPASSTPSWQSSYGSAHSARAMAPPPPPPPPHSASDDLAGLNTWDFVVMQSEFGDLQPYDNDTLINMYQVSSTAAARAPAPPPLQSSLEYPMPIFLDDTEDESGAAMAMMMRRRSDSGYSTSTRSPSSSCGSGSPQPLPLPLPLPSQSLPLPSLAQSKSSPPQQPFNEDDVVDLDAVVTADDADSASSSRRDGHYSKIRAGKVRKSKNRQLQLWEFLYQLLHENNCGALGWESRDEGVFRILQPAALAEAWGRHRGRSNMTYEKMSRTLRYYYEKQLITKVPGKQHTYKFHYQRFPL